MALSTFAECQIMTAILRLTFFSLNLCIYYSCTVEPCYKRSDTTKPSHNKANLLVPALHISLFLLPRHNKKPDTTRQPSWSQGPCYNEVPLYTPIQSCNRIVHIPKRPFAKFALNQIFCIFTCKLLSKFPINGI